MRSLSAFFVILVLATPMAGCKGRRGLDSRMRIPGADSGPTGTDGGPGVDAGPGVDSGPGIDSGPVTVDAGRDAGPPVGCSTSAECNDGLECTRDVCEAGGTCSNFDDSSLCGDGETCSAGTCMMGCSESPCRIVSPQCGCSGGDSCLLDAASGTRMCGTAGSASAGSACTDGMSCRAGLVCVGFLDLQCHRACTTDADCPGGGSICTIDVSGVSPPIRVCNPACNPITGSGCTASSCLVTQEPAGMRRFHSICVGPIGTGTLGASCTDQSGCASGYVCTTANTCEKYCRVGFSDCPTGYTCPSDGAGTVNGVDYNLCTAIP